MKTSKKTRREAKELFQSCFANGMLDETRVRGAVRLVAGAKPRGYLAVLSRFAHLVKLELDRRAARIESAAALGPDVEADVKNRLTRLYGPGLDVSFTPNPALLGGLRVKVGSDVYDGSVRARLAALEQSF